MSRRFHFVGGLLRSGSTLLCNILNQNPRFYVSSTSPLPGAVASVSSMWSRSPEFKGLLIRDRQKTLDRMSRSIRGLSEAWYEGIEGPEVIFDKSRMWNFFSPLLGNVWPDGKLVTIVRDLRAIAGSIEKQHCRTAILDEAGDLAGRTVFQRAQFMFSTEGPLGAAMLGMEDLIRRRPKNWVWLRYEDLCSDPAGVLSTLYDKLNEPVFDHDFSNVVNVAEDVDELYSLKFPHEGNGPVRRPVPNEWREWISSDIEEQINNFTFYSKFFGYSV